MLTHTDRHVKHENGIGRGMSRLGLSEGVVVSGDCLRSRFRLTLVWRGYTRDPSGGISPSTARRWFW